MLVVRRLFDELVLADFEELLPIAMALHVLATGRFNFLLINYFI